MVALQTQNSEKLYTQQESTYTRLRETTYKCSSAEHPQTSLLSNTAALSPTSGSVEEAQQDEHEKHGDVHDHGHEHPRVQ